MNYIKEINAFYDHMERNPLSASAVTLWHTLMHINNKARWAETFTVAAPVIRLKSGLKDSSFKRARTELKEKGYIDFRSRSRNQAPVYRMVRLAEDEDLSAGKVPGGVPVTSRNLSNGEGAVDLASGGMNQRADQVTDGNVDDGLAETVADGVDHLADQGAGALNKQKEKEKKQTYANTADGAISFFKENFGIASPYVNRELTYWVDRMDEQLVLHAMKRALDREKMSWGYVRAILENWEKKEIRSMKDAELDDMRFRKKQMAHTKSASFAGRVNGEVVPEWFEERKRTEENRREDEKGKGLKGDVEKETEEIRRMLVELGG